MIKVVPGDTPVTKPPAVNIPAELIVAIPVSELDQEPPAVASANCVVDPTQTVDVPMIEATVGSAFTVIVLVALKAGEPFEVNFKIIVPVKLAAGVYVTVAGEAV